ncbi:MAG TPA: universal stress protein [Kofleriaceae bacterium]|nr:universal stress protein [Kofleriaceae bacterium]
MTFHKIFCPIDFSPGSREAFGKAAELARESNAALVLAHVSETSGWQAITGFPLAPEMIHKVAATEEAELEKWKARATELGVKQVAIRVLVGTPWDQILTAVRADRAIDLIVMGTHGRTGLEHALVGSVAERIVRHAPCPVLVVRMREDR